MKGAEKIIYDIIQSQNGYIGPIKQLAELSGYSRMQVYRILRKLKESNNLSGSNPVCNKMLQDSNKMLHEDNKRTVDRDFELKVQKELEEIGDLDVEAIMEAYRNR